MHFYKSNGRMKERRCDWIAQKLAVRMDGWTDAIAII